MRLDAKARLRLTTFIEPGDPRLVPLLEDSSAQDLIVTLVEGRAALPQMWRDRAPGSEARADKILARATGLGMRWITPGDPQWHSGLDDLAHVEPVGGATGAPLGLWVRGPASLAALCGHAVAVVGARDATTYGNEVATDIAADLADNNVTIVSGAAFGIDACAHRGAMSLGKPTIAVLAGGADVAYPRAHAALIERIAADALVVSEQLPGQTPIKSRFLTRNRLIAALTAGTVVVEAARRSGSLNTLNWADQLGRVTMGVPGPVTSRASVGVHEALRTGKAMVVTSGLDVLEATGQIGTVDSTPPRAPETTYDRLPAAARRVLDALPWGVVRSAAGIVAETGFAPAEIASQLADLKRAGLVHEGPAGWTLQRRADDVPA